MYLDKNYICENTRLQLIIYSTMVSMFTLVLLYTKIVNYIFFHTIVEVISITIMYSIFIIAINTYYISKNEYFLFIGVAYGFVGLFETFHVLTYGDASSVINNSIQLSLQFSTVAKLIQAVSMILSFRFLTHKNRVNLQLLIYIIISLFFFVIIKFNLTYINLFGKFTDEVTVFCSLMMVLCILLIIKYKYKFDKYIFKQTLLMYICMCISFLLLGISTHNKCYLVIGHMMKVCYMYFLYKAFIQNTLKNPFKLLFGNLQNKNRELEKNSEKYKNLLEFLPDAVLIRKGNTIIFANNVQVNFLHAKSKEELIGRDILEFVHDDYKEIVKRNNELIEKGERLPFLQQKLIAVDGAILDAEVAISRIDLFGEDLILVVVRDVSERRKAEESERLLKEAMESEKLKFEFFSNISHELRTPINVIYSALQVIELHTKKKDLKNEYIEKYVGIVKQNCFRLLRIINNLIDITKIDAGYFKPNLIRCNIVNLVEEITGSIVSYAESKGINIIFDTEIEEKYIDCDPDMIDRIILNLLSNAIKFRKENGTIWVNICDRGQKVIISIKDNGIGIPKNMQHIIFERFMQVDKSLTRNCEGSGIGLSLVKSIVEMHKGSIALISEEGKGSEFIIELPALEDTKQVCVSQAELETAYIIEKVNIEFSDIYS